MFDWREPAAKLLDNSEAVCLVRITKTQGSTPRDTGTVMLVTAAQEYGTIGGGNLEIAAIKAARQCLRDNIQTRTLDYILGPDVEQCCGGRVVLELQNITSRNNLPQIDRPAHTPLYLFGAGHVGTALLHTLAPLPFKVQCFDTRPEKCTNIEHGNAHNSPSCHPGLDPGPRSLSQDRGPGARVGVTVKSGEFHSTQNTSVQHYTNPTGIIASAPGNTLFLIMTHDHNLDYQLVSAILKRSDFTWLGLIGSKTKKARFLSRLEKDGFADEQLSRLTCPIGIEGIEGKEPEIIAASVAAQLLQITGR